MALSTHPDFEKVDKSLAYLHWRVLPPSSRANARNWDRPPNTIEGGHTAQILLALVVDVAGMAKDISL